MAQDVVGVGGAASVAVGDGVALKQDAGVFSKKRNGWDGLCGGGGCEQREEEGGEVHGKEEKTKG